SISDSSGDGNPRSHLEIFTLADGKSTAVAGTRSSQPLWSPDRKMLAYSGEVNGKSGLIVASADGSTAKFLHELGGTNSPLPNMVRPFAWPPDSKQIVFVHTTAGPETAAASGDPVVITRYLYKPEASEGSTRFNDNKRPHLYLADVTSGAIRQL